MKDSQQTFFADEAGIWRGGSLWMGWDEVDIVSGYKLDYIIGQCLVVTLDFDFGEYIELMDDQPSFAQVAEQITARLPGIAPDWLSHLERTQPPPAETQTVWRRDIDAA